MVIPSLIGNPYNWYINPYYWVDDHPLLLCGNNGSFDPSTYVDIIIEPVDPMIPNVKNVMYLYMEKKHPITRVGWHLV